MLFFASSITSLIMIYLLLKSNDIDNFSCVASYSQHYNDERLDMSLSYVFRGSSGILSVSGTSRDGKKNIQQENIIFLLEEG